MTSSLATKCNIVIPCYNEAERLQSSEFLQYLRSNPGISLTFVNDGSGDKTLEIMRSMQAEMLAQIDILDLSVNSGKGEAVRCGLLRAMRSGAPFVGFWDADLATPLTAIADLLQVLLCDPEVDIVLGSRVKLLGRHIERRPVRHYLGRLFATCASSVLELPVYDTQCGAKMFRVTQTVEKMFEQPFLSRWIFDVEILARYLTWGSATSERGIYEFPLYSWCDVVGSRLRSRDFFRAAAELAKIKRCYSGRGEMGGSRNRATAEIMGKPNGA